MYQHQSVNLSMQPKISTHKSYPNEQEQKSLSEQGKNSGKSKSRSQHQRDSICLLSRELSQVMISSCHGMSTSKEEEEERVKEARQNSLRGDIQQMAGLHLSD
jgi:hypothetical protein